MSLSDFQIGADSPVGTGVFTREKALRMYRKMMGIESEQDARHGLPIRLGLLFAHHKEWTFSDIALSGSSDKTLRLWDLRVDKRIPPIDPSTTLRFFHPSPFQKKPFATANAERLSVP